MLVHLQIKGRELLFPFESDKRIHRTIIELKHLTSWKVCMTIEWYCEQLYITHDFSFPDEPWRWSQVYSD